MILVMATDMDNLYEHLAEYFDPVNTTVINGTTVYSVTVNNETVIFIQAGTTKVDITRNFANAFINNDITEIICTGNCAMLCSCAGEIGDIAIISKSFQYDVQFMPLGFCKAEIPCLDKSCFESDADLIRSAKDASEDSNLCYSVVCGISADRFNACSEEALRLRHCFDADALDTECGVIGEISYLYGIPSVVVKGVSNYANNDAVCQYKENRCRANVTSLSVAITMVNCMTAP